MQLSCLQENLSRGLTVVGRAVAARATLPITSNVLISTDQGRLKLVATNLEVAITTWIGADVQEEGEVTIPARILTEFVNSLPAERIDIKSSTEPLGIGLSCGRFSANVNGMPAADFPPVPTVESGVAGVMDPGELGRAINHVAFAAATDDSRPVLAGIKVEITGEDYTFAAADGFRLAVYKGKMEGAAPEDLDFIIPARTLQEVNRLLSGQVHPIEFTVTPNKNQAMFRLDNVEIVSQLIQGTFPNYSQLVPTSCGTRAVMGLSEFSMANRSAAIFARDGSGIVRVHVNPGEDGDEGKLVISSRSEEVGDNESEVDVKVEGEESKIAFNSKYLTDVLDVLESNEVALETTTPSSPGVLRPVDDDSYVHVVMPMFVQW